MAKIPNRISIGLGNDDFKSRLDAMKKEYYYDVSYAEMFRSLIDEGMRALEKKGKK